MSAKETTARIKINKLLEAAGWRFFAEGSSPANIRLEPNVTIKTSDLALLGDNFEKTAKGFIDFLLLDTRGFPPTGLKPAAMPYAAKGGRRNTPVRKEGVRASN